MSAIVTSKFRIHNSQQFVEAFSEPSPTAIYMFIGRPQAWPVDTEPPTPVDSVQDEFNYWHDMMAMKKIQSSDVTNAAIRRNWTSGVVYDQYRSDYSVSNPANSGATNLVDATFFVVTSDYNVYKCLFNNSNAASTIMPTGTSTSVITTSDGYKWKFMFNISPSDISKFVTTDFIPVQTNSAVAAAAVDGAIDVALVTNAGSGYTSATATIVGDGTGATADVVVSGGGVTAINITNRGSGYTYATISISGDGTNAAGIPVISPQGGHGSDAVEELNAFYVIMNTRLEYADGSGDFVVNNDYRRIGLIRDPFNYGTTTIASAATLSAAKTITLNSGVTGSFSSDELITGATSGAQARVIDWNSSTRVLKYYQTSAENFKAFQTSETITGSTSGAFGTSSALGNPEVQPTSGDIIYVEQRRPIIRAADQVESISLIVEF